MSLEFNAVGDYGRLTPASAVGNTYAASMVVVFRHQDSTASRIIASLSRANATGALMVVNSTTLQFHCASAQRATWTVALNSWYTVAISNDAGSGNVIMRLFGMDGNEIAVASGSNTYNGGSYAYIGSSVLGRSSQWEDSAFVCFRYWRVWTRTLTQAQFADEAAMTPVSGTPAASTTNLRGSWPLPDGTTTTDWSGNGVAITLNGGSTSSDEPTIGGAAVFIPTQYQRTNSLLRM